LSVGRSWVLQGVYAAPYVFFLMYMAVKWASTSSALEWLGEWFAGALLPFAIYLALIIAAMVSGYRRSRDVVTREKIRWVFFGFLIAGGGALMLWVVPVAVLGHPIISTSALGLLAVPYPLALAIAILPHPLLDSAISTKRS